MDCTLNKDIMFSLTTYVKSNDKTYRAPFEYLASTGVPILKIRRFQDILFHNRNPHTKNDGQA